MGNLYNLNEKKLNVSTNLKWKGKPDKIDKKLLYGGKTINVSKDWCNIELSPSDLFELLTVKGCPICCKLNGDRRKSENFISHSVAMIDIDSGMRIDELSGHEFYLNYGYGYYTTPSHTDDAHKFRIIFILENDVKSTDAMTKLYKAIIKIFTSADKSCNDSVRFFNGTINAFHKEIIGNYLPQEVIDNLINSAHGSAVRNCTIEPCDAKISHEILAMLQHIPNDMNHNERLKYCKPILKILGNAGIRTLQNHLKNGYEENISIELHKWSNEQWDNSFNPLAALIKYSKQYGYKPERLPRQIKLTYEEISTEHAFPELSNKTDLDEKLIKLVTEQNQSSLTTIRVSTGAGKTAQTCATLRKISPNKNILVLTDTHENSEEIARMINENIDVSHLPRIDQLRFFASRKPRAVVIKGKSNKCNIQSNLISGRHITRSMCNNCDHRRNRYCDYFEQIPGNPLECGNIFIMNNNDLYNDISHIFDNTFKIKEFDQETGQAFTKWQMPVPVWNAIIVDENPIKFYKNGSEKLVLTVDQLPINESIPSKVDVTKSDFLRHIFNTAYQSINIGDVTVQNLQELETIYGDDLKSVLTKASETFGENIRFHDSGDRSLNEIGVYNNVVNFLKHKDNNSLFGMRIQHGRLVQSGVKKLHSRFDESPMILLDATLNSTIVEDVIGVSIRNIDHIQYDVKISESNKIIQSSGARISKEYLKRPRNINNIVNHIKSSLPSNRGKYGLITFKELESIEKFPEYMAERIFGHDWQNHGHLTRYFGNTRGYNDMKDLDVLIIIGDYKVPQHVVENAYWAIYGDKPNLKTHMVKVPIRTSSNNVVKIDRQYINPKVQAIYEHLCLSEMEQAVGRARLIHGENKIVLIYAETTFGGNIVIDHFVDANDIFPREVFSDVTVNHLKDFGYIEIKRSEFLSKLDITPKVYSDNYDAIIQQMISNGGKIVQHSFWTKSRNKKTVKYMVFDSNKFDTNVLPHISAR
ncbi:hypothetical protein RO575_08540 [Methylomonas sp. MO1]|uniref:hypothetical protein n=1 Tax=Methylomonas sp. MO1 TaxID=3073619 RepID=UPI0028A32480|nr:hypothetical protein [Methylomonas sp. MO1]MDT4289604.1 hypothetical protein [Methylomonas sp. MO1]